MFLGYVADIYEILTEGEDEDLEDIPIALEGIQEVLKDCKQYGDEVVVKFDHVNKLLVEVMTKSQSKKQRTEAIKADVDQDIASGKVEQSKRQEMIDAMEKNIDRLEEQEDEEREKYNEALDDMTSAGAFFKGIVSDMIEPCMTMATGMLCPQMAMMQGAGQMVGGLGGGGQGGQGGQAGQAGQGGGQAGPVDSTELSIQLGNLKGKLKNLGVIFQKSAETNIYQINPNNNAAELKADFETLKGTIAGLPNCPQKTSMTDICTQAITICQTVADAPPEDATTLQGQLASHTTKANSITFPSGTNPAMQQQQQQQQQQEGEKSKSDTIHESYQKAADARGEMLKRTQERLDKERERHFQQMDKMAVLSAKLQKLDMQSQTAAEVIQVLIQGIKLFGQIAVQWKKLVAFFEKVKTMIDIGMSAPTEDFANSAESGLNQKNKRGKVSNLKKKQLSRVRSSFHRNLQNID